jgi:hypothetical protein
MEAELEVYRGRFADIRTGLGREVNLESVLIEVSLDKIQHKYERPADMRDNRNF